MIMFSFPLNLFCSACLHLWHVTAGNEAAWGRAVGPYLKVTLGRATPWRGCRQRGGEGGWDEAFCLPAERQVSIGLCLAPCRAVEVGQLLFMSQGTYGVAEGKGEEVGRRLGTENGFGCEKLLIVLLFLKSVRQTGDEKERDRYICSCLCTYVSC